MERPNEPPGLGPDRVDGTTTPQRLVLALCRRNVSGLELGRKVSSLSDQRYGEAFISRAEAHHVLGLVLHTLEGAGLLAALPEAVSRGLRKRLRKLRRAAELWRMEQSRILRLLAGQRIDPVMLKGAVLRETVYRSPVARPIQDLDLLIPLEQLQAATEVLRSAGYRERFSPAESAWFLAHHYHRELHHPAGFAVELHWALTRPSRPWQLDEEAFVERSTPVKVDELVVRAPSREDMLLHLASQNLEDRFARLRRIVDLDRQIAVSGSLDWEYVFREARRGGLELVVSYSLQLARTLLGTDVPYAALNQIRGRRIARFHLALHRPIALMVDVAVERRGFRCRSLRMWLMVRRRDRARYLLSALVGPEQELARIRAPANGIRSAIRLPLRVWATARFATQMGAYQLWLYLSAGLSLLSLTGRRQLAFWHRGAPGSSKSPKRREDRGILGSRFA